jgi:Zn-dependent protease with chaperone function
VNEDRSARYHKLGRLAAVASTAWSATLLAGLAATPASAWLRDLAGAAAAPLAAGLRPSAVVLVYVLALGAVHEVGALPIAFYRSFLLERRYGLSTEPLRHWLLDQAKGGALGAVLSFAGFSLLYLAMRHWPTWWWAVAAAGFAGVAVALTQLAPVLLLPIFFTFRPLGRPELRERLLTLSRRAGVSVTDACEWQVSDRTKKANAALAGLGRTRRILLSETLLAGHPDDEIEVILAHELGHQVHHDLWRGLALQTGVVALGLFAASRALAALAPRLGLSGVSDVAGLPVLLLTAGVASLALLPAVNAFSRSMERAADRFALDLTGSADAFATAMRRLADQNLSEEHPSRLARWWFYTHPPVADRIAAARGWTARPAGG